MSFERELRVATEAVRKASVLTKSLQSKIVAQLKTSTITKADDSPVTVADFSAQALVINALKVNFPDDKIVAEETAEGLSDTILNQILQALKDNDDNYPNFFANTSAIEFTNASYPLNSLEDVRNSINQGAYAGGRSGRFWCLDPIDGTAGFLRGAQFAVCLALVVDGEVKVGVIGCPNLSLANYGGSDKGHENEVARLGYVFRGVAGNGAYYSPSLLDAWQSATVRSISNSSDMVALEGYERGHSALDEQGTIKKTLGISRSYNLDSQVKYCLLTAGLGDAYLRMPRNLEYREKIWDHAAGNILVKEANGLHSDTVENVPLDFGSGRTLSTVGVIASSGPAVIHSQVVAETSKLIKKRPTSSTVTSNS